MMNQDMSRLVGNDGNVSMALQNVVEHGWAMSLFPASHCKVPSLKVSYQRYGPSLQRYFLEVLQMPEAGSWIRIDPDGYHQISSSVEVWRT